MVEVPTTWVPGSVPPVPPGSAVSRGLGEDEAMAMIVHEFTPVSVGLPGADGRCWAAALSTPGRPAVTALAPTLEAFFTDRLIRQRQASGHTWRLLLGYAATRNERPPSQLDLADLNAPLIGGFLDHLEHECGNRSAPLQGTLTAGWQQPATSRRAEMSCHSIK